MSFEEANEAACDRSTEAAAGLVIRTAADEYHAGAHGLVARRYADRGYLSKDLSSHADAALTICSAFEGHTTVGTIAVRLDSPRGLNADAVFAAELDQLRCEDRRLCEFGRLAMDYEVSDNKQVLARLFHLAYLHAHRLSGCDLLVVEVNPRHVAFYRRMLGFKVCAAMRLNPRVNAPAVLLTLDLQHAHEQIACYGGNPDGAALTRTLYPYFFGVEEETAMLARLRQ